MKKRKHMSMKGYQNYNKYPTTVVLGYEKEVYTGIDAIIDELKDKKPTIITVDCYPNTRYDDIILIFQKLNPTFICSDTCAVSQDDYHKKNQEYLTDDRVFGYMCHHKIENFFDENKIKEAQKQIQNISGLVVIYGVGASLIHKGDICIYADMARWEIQQRYRNGASNWNTNNAQAPILEKYKQGFFIEWRFADKHKQNVWKHMDYVLDTNRHKDPKMLSSDAFFEGLKTVAHTPFRLVPYFDPGVWGGQWMKEVCGLDTKKENYAWSFDGVPEENSLYLTYDDTRIEIPAINVVFYAPQSLLGERVHGRYGAEFPIRFDFLDTMQGQNLSLQVHPLTEYIQQNFGMNYTQDESYYILDTDETKDVHVYLGVKENVDSKKMIEDLKRAQAGEIIFNADTYVNKIKAKKHDHFLIPAGTIHCSGANTMVLEVSATPYIFTFKLWDWGRLGLDGLPRPIHIEHGEKVIQWDRDTNYVLDNLVNNFKELSHTDDCRITKTGLNEREPIETVTHRSTKKVLHTANGSVHVLNLVEGEEAIIESPTNAFAPYIVHYAETFILPASIKEYTIAPHGNSVGMEIMTIKAYIR